MDNEIYARYQRYVSVRDAAWQVLIDYNIIKLPIPLRDICRIAGIKILRDSVAHQLQDSESGVSMNQKGIWYIIYDDTDTPQRIRFTVAHELGHIFLGHSLHNGYYTRCDNLVKPSDETEADMFAARLLAPACVLWGINAVTAEQIAEVCDISMTAARIRAARLAELRKRGKFLISPLECRVYKQFENYIKNNRL